MLLMVEGVDPCGDVLVGGATGATETLKNELFPMEVAREVLSIGGYGKLTRREMRSFLKEEFPALTSDQVKTLVKEYGGRRRRA